MLTKSIRLPEDTSASVRKSLDGMDKRAQNIECFLIGQLAKNDTYKDIIDGSMILDRAIDMIRQAQNIIGKRAILVECSNNPNVMSFYLNNGFKHIGKNDDNKLEQMVYKLEKITN